MVDVTFLLLSFFTVTASFSWQRFIIMLTGTEELQSLVDVPQLEDRCSIVIEIDSRGQFTVLATHWERSAAGKQNLIRALRDVSSVEASFVAVVEPHEDCMIHAVIDAIDAATTVRCKDVRLRRYRGDTGGA